MTAQTPAPEDNGSHDLIHLGGETAVVVPLAEYRLLRALAAHASEEALEIAEEDAAMAVFHEAKRAGYPGALSHEEVVAMLPDPDQ